MKKRIYNTPLTCADLLMVGIGQIMVDSTSKSVNPTSGDIKPTFGAPARVGKIYI